MAEEHTFSTWKGLMINAFENGAVTFVFLVIVTILIFYLRFGKKKAKLPPGPTGIPILGYLPFLGREPYKHLDELKHIYGNVFSLYLGRDYTVIIADYEALKDAYNQLSVLGRPQRIFDSIPNGVGFSGNSGAEWVEQRRFCVKWMKDQGVGRERWLSIIQCEVDDFIQLVSYFNGQPVNICQMLTSSVSNNITSFVFGRRFPLNNPEREFLDHCINEIMASLTQTGIFNIFPFLRRACIKLGVGRITEIHNTMLEFNEFIRKEIKKLRPGQNNIENESFIADYLKEMDNKNKEHYFNDTNLIGNIQALFLGGSETTRSSVYHLLLIMADKPDIQSKVHHEVDSVIGKDGHVEWMERKKLPYTLAVILEMQRWMTLVPLNTARLVLDNIMIQGYDIPKGTHIVTNIWGLHHDVRYWKNPDAFSPERFLVEGGKDIIMKPESYIPFSYGRRNCPGETVAMMEILLYFVALMQNFNVSAPAGKKISLEGHLGLTYEAMPQELCFVPRP